MSYDNSYHFAKQAAWALADASTIFDGPLPAPPANPGAYRETMATALGVLNFYDANYNYDLEGNPLTPGRPREPNVRGGTTGALPPGHLARQAGPDGDGRPALVRHAAGPGGERTPGQHHAGSRRLHRSPPGFGGRTAGPRMKRDPSVSCGPTMRKEARLWNTHYKNFSPRLAVAFSPDVRNGFLGKLFGSPGQTSIRAGVGIFYSSFGMGMMQMLDRNAFGLTSKVTNQISTVAAAPRFAGISTLPAGGILPAPPGGPGTPNPTGLGWSQGVDSSVRPPYSINPTVSMARELDGGFLLEIAYVGRLGRRLLVNDTAAAQYTNFRGSGVGPTFDGLAPRTRNHGAARGCRPEPCSPSGSGRTSIPEPPHRRPRRLSASTTSSGPAVPIPARRSTISIPPAPRSAAIWGKEPS